MNDTEKRHQTLMRLIERYVPDNTAELLDRCGQESLPPYISIERGPSGDWLTLHESGQAALDYFAQDDSDYEPRSLVHLDSGEERLIEVEVNYRIGDTSGSFVS